MKKKQNEKGNKQIERRIVSNFKARHNSNLQRRGADPSAFVCFYKQVLSPLPCVRIWLRGVLIY